MSQKAFKCKDVLCNNSRKYYDKMLKLNKVQERGFSKCTGMDGGGASGAVQILIKCPLPFSLASSSLFCFSCFFLIFSSLKQGTEGSPGVHLVQYLARASLE